MRKIATFDTGVTPGERIFGLNESINEDIFDTGAIPSTKIQILGLYEELLYITVFDTVTISYRNSNTLFY